MTDPTDRQTSEAQPHPQLQDQKASVQAATDENELTIWERLGDARLFGALQQDVEESGLVKYSHNDNTLISLVKKEAGLTGYDPVLIAGFVGAVKELAPAQFAEDAAAQGVNADGDPDADRLQKISDSLDEFRSDFEKFRQDVAQSTGYGIMLAEDDAKTSGTQDLECRRCRIRLHISQADEVCYNCSEDSPWTYRVKKLRRLYPAVPEHLCRGFVFGVDLPENFVHRVQYGDDFVKFLAGRNPAVAGVVEMKRISTRVTILEDIPVSSRSGRTREQQAEFRHAVMTAYFGEYDEDDLTCLVSGSKDRVEAAHLIPVSAQSVEAMYKEKYTRPFSVWDAKNGIPLCHELHAAYDDYQWAFMVDVKCKYKVFVYGLEELELDQRKTHPLAEFHLTEIPQFENPDMVYRRALGWRSRQFLKENDSRTTLSLAELSACPDLSDAASVHTDVIVKDTV